MRTDTNIDLAGDLAADPTVQLATKPAPDLAPSAPVPGRYVDTFWLPLLGPTAVITAARLAERAGTGQPADLAEIAAEIGVGIGGKNRRGNPMLRAIARMHHRRLIDWNPATRTLSVPTRLPLLGGAQVASLPPSLRPMHVYWVEEMWADYQTGNDERPTP